MKEQTASNNPVLSTSPLILDGLLSAVVDQILVFSREGIILYANRYALKTLAIEAEAIIGRHWSDAQMPLDYFEPIKQNLPYVLNQHEAVRKEISRMVDGEQMYFDYVITPVKTDEGDESMAVIHIRDITDQKRMINAVHNTETRFGITLDNSPIGMAMLDVSGVFFTANKKMCDMLACGEKDLTGKNIRQLIYEDDLDDFLVMIECMLEGKQRSFQQNLRLSDSRNVMFWSQMTFTMVRNPGGQPHYFILQAIDIRFQKELEIELAREQRYSAALLNQLPTAAFIVDQSHQIQHWNDKLNQLLGYSDEELQIMQVRTLLNLENQDELNMQLASGGMLDRVSLIDKQGGLLPCYLTFTVLPYDTDSMVIVQVYAGLQS